MRKPFLPEEIRSTVLEAVRGFRVRLAEGVAEEARWARLERGWISARDEMRILSRIRMVNRAGLRVGLLFRGPQFRRDTGLGRALVERLLAEGRPVEVLLGRRDESFQTVIAEMDQCDRLMILELADTGVAPGVVTAEVIGGWGRLAPDGRGGIAMLRLQPAGEATGPLGYGPERETAVAARILALME